MRVLTFACLLVLCFSAALASNPGEPLDCADWVILEPGLTCTEYPIGQGPSDIWQQGKGASVVTDNMGRMLTLRFTFPFGYDGDPKRSLGKIEVVTLAGTSEQVIAHISDRDTVDAVDHIRPTEYKDFNLDRASGAPGGLLYEPLAFDAVNGELFIFVFTYCMTCSSSYPQSHSIIVLQGFPTLFEILHNYTPSASLNFRTPYMPEGFQHADYFDTYYGSIGSFDLAQAQPLQCGYPSTPPNVGDYLTVADTLGAPAPGEGWWYLTSVTLQGETRIGRKASGGVLSGRDSSVLPGCSD